MHACPARLLRVLAHTLSAKRRSPALVMGECRLKSKGIGGLVGSPLLFLSSFSGRWSKEATEINFLL